MTNEHETPYDANKQFEYTVKGAVNDCSMNTISGRTFSKDYIDTNPYN